MANQLCTGGNKSDPDSRNNNKNGNGNWKKGKHESSYAR